MLEVRNEGWTDEAINKYLQFLDYAVEDRLKLCDNNLEKLTAELFEYGKKDRFGPPTLDPIKIVYNDVQQQNYCGCNLGLNLTIQFNDLTLIPCHRLAYPFYHGGRFINNGEKITEIKALDNLNGYMNLIHKNAYYAPGCVQCDYRECCLRGCTGA
jgi:radical SAM protein with 4Fe4S-binding SPASM domain